MRQKDYIFFLEVPLRAEILQNPSKIEQNLIKILQFSVLLFVRFWIDFVGFLAEGDTKPPSKVKTIHFRRSVIFELFRTAFTPVPTAPITHSAVVYRGKVTSERPLDDAGKGVSKGWDECK